MRDEQGVQTFAPCSNTANPSLTIDGFKMMFNRKPAWLSGRFGWTPFQNPALHLHQPLGASLKDNSTINLIQ